MKRRIQIAVTMGDPCGIGPEVVARAVLRIADLKEADFCIVGDASVLAHYGWRPQTFVSVVDLKNAKRCLPGIGVPSRMAARASLEYLDAAVALIRNKEVDALVTAPISKEAVSGAGFSWPGHTEFLAHALDAKQVEMIFVSKALKVVLLSRHLSLRDAVKAVRRERIVACGKLIFVLLKKYFKMKSPKIAVAGLNPHASESGLFGKEEAAEITPAIRDLNRVFGQHFFGPYAPDSVFYRTLRGEFDCVIAMHHDQGLIAFKCVAFENGVHLTAGLPIVRTSCVHGTAFDIAGNNRANEESMVSALRLAYQLTKNSL